MELTVLFDQLVRFETELWNAVDARLRRDFQLPLARFEPMKAIDEVPSCRVQDIAARLSITIGGTSKLVDRIESAGHCRRVANPRDRRSSLIELTPRGRRLLVEAGRAFDEELATRIGSAVTPRQLAQFTSVLERLRAHSAAVDGPGPLTAAAAGRSDIA
ncbi:hypothetical protein MMAD_02430 [Mycolicibacterium madagascariense]|uniref:HTH marR-type domain-containing protein n=1 Tax=Mycolicibacterium madagascariense TaxID=212765 RepID=A0A7I7XC50_9MYCO|nr:MarR family winged helix-turn-helix transcriptional regulator [Mycolicibacterium madagascariense]BBZ25948.1 hypothetical protein MMAD_02430 [Mycolicibacterium madagascariense]